MTEVEFIVGLLWAQMEASEEKIDALLKCIMKTMGNIVVYMYIYILV